MGGKDILLGGRHHGRELIEVADEDHLEAAERLSRVRAVEAEEPIDAIDKVGADHRDLVDDDGVEVLIEHGSSSRDLLDLVEGDVGLEPAERVDGLTEDVERGDAGGRQDGDLLPGRVAEVIEERGFPRARLAGDEDVLAGRLHDIEGAAELGVDLNSGGGGGGRS